MAITISGENNNDRITAQDGVIDTISGFNIAGIITASSFTGDLTGNVTGNLTGNVNSTSPLLLQTGGSERFRITGNNELGIAGANYGTSGQVLTSGGSGSAVSWVTPAVTAFTNGSNNRVVTATSGSGLNGEANLTYDGSKLVLAANSTAYDAFQVGNGLFIGNTTNNVSAAIFHQGGGADLEIGSQDTITFTTGSTAGNAIERLRIDSEGKTTLKSTLNGEIFRIETSAGNPGGTQGLAYMGFDHFPASTKPAILIGSEEAGNASYMGNFVIKLKDAAATDDDPVQRFKIDSSGRVIIGRASAYGSADADNLIVGDEAVNEHQGITILSHSGKYGGIYFGDGAGSNPAERGKIIYDHPNDQLRMGTAGSAATQFYINSSGYVGVNGSPSARLDVKQDNAVAYNNRAQSITYGAARFLNTSGHQSGGTYTGFQFNLTGNSQNRICAIGAISEASNSRNASLVFATDDNGNRTEKLRITSDGKVVAGGTGAGYPCRLQSHGAGDLLDLNSTSGAGKIRFYESGSGRFNIETLNGSSGLRFYDSLNGVERLRIKSDGRIGINNNNPTHPLHIVNTSSTFNSASLIKGDNSTSGQGAYATFTNTADSKSAYFGLDGNGLFAIDPGAALVGTNGSEPIIFATNGNAERFRIQASTTATVLVQQASGADVFYVNTDTAETRTQNSLTHINYGLAIGKSRTQNSTGYGTAAVWSPYYAGEGEKVFGIDPSWSQAELRRFFGNDTVEWYAEEDAPGGYCIKVTGACNVGSNYNSGFPYIPIDDDDQFFQEMWIRTDAGNSVNHYGGSIQLDKDFSNPTGNPGSFGYELMSNHTTNDATWRRRTATLGPNHGTSIGSFRNNYTGGKRKYCTPQLLLNYQHNSGSRVCYISGWAWYRRRSRGNTHFASISADSNKGFRIPHPLTSKRDKYDLFHNALEGPKMDLIYRGKVNLVGGSSTVNLDTANEMTEGTFVLLNHNVQCFTSNESGWTPVKGSVSGNILTITAQDNTSTDTIAWMVVGERHDDCAKGSEFTDDTGKLIVELRKDQQYVGVSTTPMVAPGMES